MNATEIIIMTVILTTAYIAAGIGLVKVLKTSSIDINRPPDVIFIMFWPAALVTCSLLGNKQ